MTMKLLVIDDNVALGWRLQNYLDSQFDVQVARTGAEGQRRAQIKQYDVIILDLGLPDIQGEEVCRLLRQNGVMTPVLVLTAAVEIDSKVRLLEMGADDYLTKPFDLAELRARIHALVRRRQAEPNALLTAGDLIVDPNRRMVKRGDVHINLRRKEFDILEYLVRNRGKIVTQEMIREHVWDETEGDLWNNTIRVHIKYLRDKIDRPFGSPLIKTAHGVGYTLEV